MRLKEYLDASGIKYKAFASQIGMSYNSLARILNGGGCRMENVEKIERATKGKVKYKDLLPRKEETDK